MLEAFDYALLTLLTVSINVGITYLILRIIGTKVFSPLITSVQEGLKTAAESIQKGLQSISSQQVGAMGPLAKGLRNLQADMAVGGDPIVEAIMSSEYGHMLRKNQWAIPIIQSITSKALGNIMKGKLGVEQPPPEQTSFSSS